MDQSSFSFKGQFLNHSLAWGKLSLKSIKILNINSLKSVNTRWQVAEISHNDNSPHVTCIVSYKNAVAVAKIILFTRFPSKDKPNVTLEHESVQIGLNMTSSAQLPLAKLVLRHCACLHHCHHIFFAKSTDCPHNLSYKIIRTAQIHTSGHGNKMTQISVSPCGKLIPQQN